MFVVVLIAVIVVDVTVAVAVAAALAVAVASSWPPSSLPRLNKPMRMEGNTSSSFRASPT
jgi:hypothetical protein